MTLSNFVLTLPLVTQPFQEDILNKRLEIARRIYNACLGELYKRYNLLKQSKSYQKTIKMLKGPARNKAFRDLNKVYGLTEYSLHTYVKPMQHHFKINIDSSTAQKIATRCFKAFEKLIFGLSRKVYFKKYGDLNSIEGKSNNTGIRFRNNQFLWNKLETPIIIKQSDLYTQMALTRKIKYCRIVRKLIRGKFKFYVQLILEGTPPLKHKTLNNIVGLDMGTQTIAICSINHVNLLELAPEINNIEQEKRILSRKLDRQRRINNPSKYHKDGQIDHSNKDKWIYSNKYRKTQYKLKELHRKQAAIRRQAHEKLANYVLSLGTTVKVETMNYRALQARSKKTTINDKTGKYNKKKRFGKSLGNKAPSLFLTILDNKLKWYGKALIKIDTVSVKASQYNHFDNTYTKKALSERWNLINNDKIQRDLYSAFLIMTVKDDLKTIDRHLCFQQFNNFKTLHDLEISRIKQIKNNKHKLISSMGL